MIMGFVGIPVTIFLYWLILRYKKTDPFPKTGILRLVLAGVVSVILSVILSMPVGGIIAFVRLGAASDFTQWIQAIKDNSEGLSEMVINAKKNIQPTFLWSLISMFFTAGLLEEGLKFLTCRVAIRKEGMIRTWMDSVIAFAFVGITFEFLENISFGAGSDLASAIARALAPAHFVFGVIMGYFFGKYRVTGQKKYCWLSFVVPVIYHTVTNALIGSMELSPVFRVLGMSAAISHIVAAIVTVIIVFHWQKNKTLDVPVQQKQAFIQEQ